MIHVMVVFGTRPEMIKMAPVVFELERRSDIFEVTTCATAQHRELLDQMLPMFGLRADVDLDLMRPGQTLNELTARVLTGIAPVLDEARPDWVLVQGDTTTVLSSALAAHHTHVKVGHVEAGLRTWDRQNPFPEEMNRVLADHLSDLCFAPTAGAKENLLREGIPEARIQVTGNTVIDALLWARDQPLTGEAGHILAGLGVSPEADAGAPDVILVTAHRRESFGEPLEHICEALREIGRRGDGALKLIYPVHPNPRVREPVYRLLSEEPNIALIEPVDYLTLVTLMRRSKLILTDSGGIQEEAPSLGVPVLVLRETTERPEAVAAGAVKLVGTDREVIVSETFRLLDDTAAYDAMARSINPYGDGRAAERIVQALYDWEAPKRVRGA